MTFDAVSFARAFGLGLCLVIGTGCGGGGDGDESCVTRADCAAGEVCLDGRCTVYSEGMDGGPDGAPRDGSVGSDGSSCDPSGCSDGLACTRDSCGPDGCEHTPDDSLCVAGPDGRCDPALGCQYSSCTAETCTPDSDCQTAMCDGDTCVRESSCTEDETCCGGSCVEAGCTDGTACTVDMCGAEGCEHVPDDAACDDGNPCTDDVCDPVSGCQHTNNTAPCDDGMFCNGSDTCSGGGCTQHAGDPCGGSSTCDESAGACVGCEADGDCPPDTFGAWSTCSFGGTCDESGIQTRSVTTYSCVGSECEASTSSQSQSCSRDTDGTTCGSTDCDDYGPCENFVGTCGEMGRQSRTCTDRVCSGGSCTDSTRTEGRSCTRDTDGTSCGSTTCGSCGDFSNTCDETGSQTCTDPVCSGGSCTDSTRTEPCTRDTDGTSCSDGIFCNGLEECSGGSCTDQPDPCVDNCECQDISCNETTDSCDSVNTSGSCNDDSGYCQSGQCVSCSPCFVSDCTTSSGDPGCSMGTCGESCCPCLLGGC